MVSEDFIPIPAANVSCFSMIPYLDPWYSKNWRTISFRFLGTFAALFIFKIKSIWKK